RRAGYGHTRPTSSDASNNPTTAPNGTVVITPAPNTAASMYTTVSAGAGNAAALVPAGFGGLTATGTDFADRPLSYALDDAKAAVISAMNGDSAANRTCRNYIIVLRNGGEGAEVRRAAAGAR